MITAYVVTWAYLDGSAGGAIAVAWTKESALRLATILQEHGDTGKKYAVDAVPCEALP